MKSRTTETACALRPLAATALICLLISTGLMSLSGCSSQSSGDGPEVLPKKYPGGGSTAARPAAAGAVKTVGSAPSGGKQE